MLKTQNDSFEQALKQANDARANGDFEDAFKALKLAISLDRHNEKAVSSLRDLVSITNDNIMQSLEQLHTAETRDVALKRLLFLLSTENQHDVSIKICRDPRGPQLLVSAMNCFTDADVQLSLLRILFSCTKFDDTLDMVSKSILDKETVIILLSHSTDARILSNATELLSVCMSKMIQNAIKLDHMYLLVVNTLLQLASSKRNNEEIQKCALGGLLKCFVSKEVSRFLVDSQKDLMLLLSLASTSCKPIVSIILSRLFDQYGDDDRTLEDACIQILIKWYESSSQDQTTCALFGLSAIFQAKPSVGSKILQQPGIMDEVVEVLEFHKVNAQLATLEVLSSACSDKSCRLLIVDKCTILLKRLSKNSDANLKSAALSTLIKTLTDKKDMANLILNDVSVIQSFVTSIADPITDITTKLNSVEALAYLSIHAEVKEFLVSDISIIKSLFALISREERSIQYGISTIFLNMTNYKKRMTEEEEQIQKLRVMAKEAINEKPDHRDTDGPVETRGELLTKNGLIPYVAAQTLFNVINNKANRGFAIQQGSVKSLITLFSTCSPEVCPIAAQALAKLAITADPNIAFKGEIASELVRPFVTLCNGDNPLRQFEALMGLTNLASMVNNSSIRETIISAKGVKAMEMLQFSDNAMIQRAATEAICNMMMEPAIYDSYASATSCAKLKIFIALSNAQDIPTRRAASGVLAILTSSDNVCKLMQEDERALEIIYALCNDRDLPELCHRGVECLKNMSVCGGDIARNVILRGGLLILEDLAGHSVDVISTVAKEALDALKKLK